MEIVFLFEVLKEDCTSVSEPHLICRGPDCTVHTLAELTGDRELLMDAPMKPTQRPNIFQVAVVSL